jgi:hypothetical protein
MAMNRLRGMLIVASSLSLLACTTASGPTVSRTGAWQVDMIARGRAEHFDTNHVQADRRRLMTRSSFLGLFTTRGYGTDAEIQPRDGAFSFPHDSLNHGYISARIITHGNGDYPKYHLPESDTIYLYVRYQPGVDSSAYFIPTKGSAIGAGWVEYIHNTAGANLSLAKWLFDWNDELAWMTCVEGGCCRVR